MVGVNTRWPLICMNPVNRLRTTLHTWMSLHKVEPQSYFDKIPKYGL